MFLGHPAQRLSDDAFRLHHRAEEPAGHLGNGCLLLCEGPTRGQGGGCAHALHVWAFARLPHAAHQQSYIRALPPPIGVQLVEHQEAQAVRGVDDLFFVWPGKQQFQHHVVGQQDVGRVEDDLLPLGLIILPGVAPEGDRGLALWKTGAQELL